MDLETKMRKEMIRFLVQKYIFCPATGKVLDMDTCAVVLDHDGDPFAVFDPSAREAARAYHNDSLEVGYTWMDRS